jgi:hypothetical protein
MCCYAGVFSFLCVCSKSCVHFSSLFFPTWIGHVELKSFSPPCHPNSPAAVRTHNHNRPSREHFHFQSLAAPFFLVYSLRRGAQPSPWIAMNGISRRGSFLQARPSQLPLPLLLQHPVLLNHT